MEKQLSEFELSALRDKGILRENEVAYRVGDLVVAENVVTRERRVLEEAINENKKRILKG
jgi:hypothetical protein